MKLPRLTLRQWFGWAGFALVFLLTAAVAVWRGDILRAGLDPQVPFQTYQPPPAPDYARPEAWALNEVRALRPAEVRTAVSFRTGDYAPDFHAFETDNFIILPWDREIIQGGELVMRPDYAARL